MKWLETDYNNVSATGDIVTVEREHLSVYLNETIILYTMDDDPPFGYQGKVLSIEGQKSQKDGITPVYIIKARLVKNSPRYEFTS